MQDKPLEKKSQSPLYQQLMTRLKNDITAGAYPAGARIPSEQVLCDTYGVSRVTVRKAMLDLVQEGLLVRRQGKGTFVADERIQRNLQQVTSFSDACRLMGSTPGTRVISAFVIQAEAETVQQLGLPGDLAVEIIRLRLAGEEEAARRVVRQLNVSYRRVGRAMAALIMAGAVEEGATDDEMYQF